jgi:hypothetical protein
MEKFKDYLNDQELNDRHEQAKENFKKDIRDTYGEEQADSWLERQNTDDLLK